MDAVSRLRGQRTRYDFGFRLPVVIHYNNRQCLRLVARISGVISQWDSAEDIDRVRHNLSHIEFWPLQSLGKLVGILVLRRDVDHHDCAGNTLAPMVVHVV